MASGKLNPNFNSVGVRSFVPSGAPALTTQEHGLNQPWTAPAVADMEPRPQSSDHAAPSEFHIERQFRGARHAKQPLRGGAGRIVRVEQIVDPQRHGRPGIWLPLQGAVDDGVGGAGERVGVVGEGLADDLNARIDGPLRRERPGQPDVRHLLRHVWIFRIG